MDGRGNTRVSGGKARSCLPLHDVSVVCLAGPFLGGYYLHVAVVATLISAMFVDQDGRISLVRDQRDEYRLLDRANGL